MIIHEQLPYDEWLNCNEEDLQKFHDIIDSDMSYDEYIKSEYIRYIEYTSIPVYETFDEWIGGNRTKFEEHFKDKNITDVDKMSEILYYEYLSYVNLHGILYTLTLDDILPSDIKIKLYGE